MEITSVRAKRVNQKNTTNLIGVATAILDNEFIITDIKIIQGKERLFLSMPSQKMQDGRYSDIVHPLTKDCRTKFEEAVLNEFKRVSDK